MTCSDSRRLRLGISLLASCCSQLKLRGPFSLKSERAGGKALMLFVTDDMADFLRLGLMTSSISGSAGPWSRQSHFVLDEALRDQLLLVAGISDDGSPERRARKRTDSVVRVRSLHW